MTSTSTSTSTSAARRDAVWLGTARQLVLADRHIGRLACTFQGLLRRTLSGAVPAHLHDVITRRVYDNSLGWRAGGHQFEQRLFSWEEEFLAEKVQGQGFVLLGGAGGGREVAGLIELGHDVVAFEPSDLVESAKEVADHAREGKVIRASYADLVDACKQSGPLADVPFEHCDAVILGWGSICHLTTRTARIATLQAIKSLMPSAPLLYSFNWRGEDERPFSDRQRLHFDPELGYFAALQWADVEHEAAAAGFAVTRARSEPSSYAWLEPSLDPLGAVSDARQAAGHPRPPMSGS